MSLFDRLRPKWKHADPSVRVAAVKELTDQEVLENLADEDPSDDVRLAAVQALTDQDVLVRIALGKTKLAFAAVERLTAPSAIGRVALGAEQSSVRLSAVERIDDVAILQRVAGFDHDAAIRSRARAKTAGADHARKLIRDVMAKLSIAETKPAETAEFSGTLDDVCHALVKDPRFSINGGGIEEDESQLAHAAEPGAVEAPKVTATTSARVLARFLAQSRMSVAGAEKSAAMVRFYQIRVWRTQQDAFGAVAEEKNLAMTNDAVAWSKASSGTPETRPMADVSSAGG